MKELSEVHDDCNIKEERLDESNDVHTGKYMTQLLTSQLALVMKTVMTTRITYMKRRTFTVKYNKI